MFHTAESRFFETQREMKIGLKNLVVTDGLRYFAKQNETKRYFAKRYFAKWYFAKRYFAKWYFVKWKNENKKNIRKRNRMDWFSS